MAQKKLAIVFLCSDWRLHRPVINLNARLIEHLGVEGMDLFVLPGPDGLWQEKRKAELDVTISQLKMLIKAHNPCVLALAGHEDCAAHKVCDADHETDTLKSAKLVREASGFTGPMHAMLLTHESDDDWGLKALAVIS